MIGEYAAEILFLLQKLLFVLTDKIVCVYYGQYDIWI